LARSWQPVQVGINLKLYLNRHRTVEYASSIARIASLDEAVSDGRVEVWLAPATPFLHEVGEVVRDSPVQLAAQNVDVVSSPALTGGIHVRDLADLGCRRVIVGHAERRRAGESSDVVAAKVRLVDGANLRAVVCIGESREGTPTAAIEQCSAQIRQIGSLGRHTTIAYEPVWAIGAAAPPAAAHVCEVMGELRSRFPDSAFIYGGSAGPGLLSGLAPSADGIFLGRFGHDPLAVAEVIAEAGRVAVARSQERGVIPQAAGIAKGDRGDETRKGSR
jgi:triosephosphate isomerase